MDQELKLEDILIDPLTVFQSQPCIFQHPQFLRILLEILSTLLTASASYYCWEDRRVRQARKRGEKREKRDSHQGAYGDDEEVSRLLKVLSGSSPAASPGPAPLSHLAPPRNDDHTYLSQSYLELGTGAASLEVLGHVSLEPMLKCVFGSTGEAKDGSWCAVTAEIGASGNGEQVSEVSPEVCTLILTQEVVSVQTLLEMCGQGVPEVVEEIFTYLDRQFILKPQLFRLLHVQGYDVALLPRLIAHVPSMQLAAELVPVLLECSDKTMIFGVHLMSALSRHHPTTYLQNIARYEYVANRKTVLT